LRYRKNPDNNEVFVVNSEKVVSSGWLKKQKIARVIRKEIEKELKRD
jgi:hypothetical protein